MSESRLANCACGAIEIRIEGSPAVMAFCHCDSCRSWLGAPLHAASLWTTENVTVAEGEAFVGMYKRTELSLRHFCTKCGSPVFVRHPALGLTDVPAGSISAFKFEPTIHVNYAERVLSMPDGLPKFAGMPAGDGKDEMIED